MTPIKVVPTPEPVKNQVIVLKNVEFETGKWDILPRFVPELDKLVKLLNAYPDATYMIAGHTDNVGKDADNQLLSENRAKAVVTYVVGKGIKAERLEAKGFGEAQPKATNDTAEGRQRNRRVELVRK